MEKGAYERKVPGIQEGILRRPRSQGTQGAEVALPLAKSGSPPGGGGPSQHSQTNGDRDAGEAREKQHSVFGDQQPLGLDRE